MQDISRKCFIWTLPLCCLAAVEGKWEPLISPCAWMGHSAWGWGRCSVTSLSTLLPLAVSAWFPGRLWHWIMGGKAFSTFGPFCLLSLPCKLDLRERINCVTCFLTFDSAGILCQPRLPLGDPEPKDEVGSLELHSCCSSSFSDTFVCTWLLWWEQSDLGRLTATRAWLSSVELLTGCMFWKGGIYVPVADWWNARELPRDLWYSRFYSCWRLLNWLKLHPHLDYNSGAISWLPAPSSQHPALHGCLAGSPALVWLTDLRGTEDYFLFYHCNK